MQFANSFLIFTFALTSLHGGVSAKRIMAGESKIIASQTVAAGASPKAGSNDESSSSSTASALGYRSGDMLFGRFKLRSLITANSSAGLRYLPFPKDMLGERFHGPSITDSPVLLGSGSFGETWVVTDSSGKYGHVGELLALKLFYTQGPSGFDFLTKDVIENANAELKKKYEDTIKECKLAQKVQTQAKNRIDWATGNDTKNQIALYASRLMKCFEHADDPAYVLLSYGGETTLEDHIKGVNGVSSNSSSEIGSIFEQLLQGLQQLAWCDPPLIHHDLKSQNAVVQMVDGKPRLTIIDFGGFVEYTDKKQIRDSVSTLTIAPPEWRGAFDDEGDFTYCETLHRGEGYMQWAARMAPWAAAQPVKKSCSSAFDIYSAGCILVEMLSGYTPFMWTTVAANISNPLEHPVTFDHSGALSKLMGMPELAGDIRSWYGHLLQFVKGKPMYEWIEAKLTSTDALASLGDSWIDDAQNKAKRLTPDAKSFVDQYLPLMLARHAEDRPDVESMLSSKWFSGHPGVNELGSHLPLTFDA